MSRVYFMSAAFAFGVACGANLQAWLGGVGHDGNRLATFCFVFAFVCMLGWSSGERKDGGK